MCCAGAASNPWCSTPMPASWTAAWLCAAPPDGAGRGFRARRDAAARRGAGSHAVSGRPRHFWTAGCVCASRESGFRSGLDAVMLAAAVPAAPGQTALELGAGAGTASLCLAARVPHVPSPESRSIPTLAALATDNAAANGMDERVTFRRRRYLRSAAGTRSATSIMCSVNPPFHGEGQASPDAARARALMDDGTAARLAEAWPASARFPAAYFTAILRADRLNEALAALPAAASPSFRSGPGRASRPSG